VAEGDVIWDPTTEPVEKPESRNHIEAWAAVLANGEQVNSEEYTSFDHLPGPVESVTIRVGGVEHHVSCIPHLKQRLRWFTRRAHKFGGPDATHGEPANMPVVEIITDGVPGPYPRLYIHPRHGVMFSTLDLQL
jgi:hypothetical protein